MSGAVLTGKAFAVDRIIGIGLSNRGEQGDAKNE